MTLDDLMDVWRAHDASPPLDKTLLQLALRQDQARLQKLRRRTRWFIYGVSALLFVMGALFLAIMIDPNDDDVLFVWDYVVALVGAAAAIILAGAMYVTHRAQAAREQGFGDSLRDQLRRRIAQRDEEATGERRRAWIIVAAALICGTAISIAAKRVNDVPYSEIAWSPFPIVVIFVFALSLSVWTPRRSRENLARKEQLEALLKELDGA
jgi:peptidoglycan/LPS O-acetylase OafA/YrhL